MINAFISFSSHSYKLYNIFPWLGLFLNSKRIIVRNVLKNRAQIVKLIAGLQETLNPHDRRGFVDSFLIRKQSEEEQVPCGIEIQEKAISKQLWCLNGIILVENFEWIIIKYFVTFFPPPYLVNIIFLCFVGLYLSAIEQEGLTLSPGESYHDGGKSLCRWYWHHRNDAALGFDAYGQIPSYTG